MNTRLIVPAMLGALLFSTPVLARGAGPYDAAHYWARPNLNSPLGVNPAADKCNALKGQFDKAIETHGAAAKATVARTMSTEGANLCAAGDWNRGVVKLETALNDLGVTPKA